MEIKETKKVVKDPMELKELIGSLDANTRLRIDLRPEAEESADTEPPKVVRSIADLKDEVDKLKDGEILTVTIDRTEDTGEEPGALTENGEPLYDYGENNGPWKLDGEGIEYNGMIFVEKDLMI